MKRFLAVIVSSAVTCVFALVYIVVAIITAIAWALRYVIGAALGAYLIIVLLGYIAVRRLNWAMFLETGGYIVAALLASFIIHRMLRFCFRKLDAM